MTTNTAVGDDIEVIIDKLREAVRRRFGAGADLDKVDVATVGGIDRTVLFDVVEGAVRRRLVLRQETYTTEYSPFLPPAKQWPLLEVCVRHGVPVPAPVFALEDADQLGRGYVVAFVAGETLPKRLLTDAAFAPARALFTGQAGAALARLWDRSGGSDDPGRRAGQHRRARRAARGLRSLRPAAPGAGICLSLPGTVATGGHAQGLHHGSFVPATCSSNPEQGLMALLDWECSRGCRRPKMNSAGSVQHCWRFGVMDKEAGGFGTRGRTHHRLRRPAGAG